MLEGLNEGFQRRRAIPVHRDEQNLPNPDLFNALFILNILN